MSHDQRTIETTSRTERHATRILEQNERSHQEFYTRSRTQSLTVKRSGLEDLEMNNY